MENIEKKQEILIKSRNEVIADGVINVISFCDDELEIATTLGELFIEGENLRIMELAGDGGKILVKGRINGAFYKNEREEKRHLFLKK